MDIKNYLGSNSALSTFKSAGFSDHKIMEFKTQMVSMIANNQNLTKCEPITLFNCALKIKSLGIGLGTDRAYIIPYNDKKTGIVVAQLQIGYKGYIELATKSGFYEYINVSDVKQGEKGSNDRLTGKINGNGEQNDEKRKVLPTIGYVASMKTLSGMQKDLYMSIAELNEHRDKFSQNKGVIAGFEAMAKKTVLKLLLTRFGILSPELQIARTYDSATIVDDKPLYIDNDPQERVDMKRELQPTGQVKTYTKNVEEFKEVDVASDPQIWKIKAMIKKNKSLELIYGQFMKDSGSTLGNMTKRQAMSLITELENANIYLEPKPEQVKTNNVKIDFDNITF